MTRRQALLLALAAVATLAAPPVTAAGGPATDGQTGSPRIVAAYPNPTAAGDAGEYVVVALPADADPSRYALTDGESNVSLADAPSAGRIVVATDRRAVNLTSGPHVLAPTLALANGGERLRLTRAGTTVLERRYRDASAGEVARWNGSRLGWRTRGATDRPVVRATGGSVRAFVLPDAGGLPVEVLRDADRRLLLAGYTLTSRRVTEALLAAHRSGVTVRVLLEGSPIGGRSSRGARALDRLAAAGIEVRVLGGPADRYAYHHAKYAVVDDRAVVLTENWKPAGVGGNDSRGWGVVTDQSRVVGGLVATFRADAGWRDARPWTAFRQGRVFEQQGRARGSYPRRFAPERVPVAATELLVTPDNARPRVVRALDRANESVDVIGVTLGSWGGSLPRALRRAALRGVEVRLLLSSAWYAREENRERAARYREWARAQDAPLSVSLADPAGRYGKVHAKGAVIDDELVVLGSLNWNDAAATENRETVLLLHGREIAAYYGAVFDADWDGGRQRLPLGIVAAVAGVLVLAGLVARRVEFAA